MSKQKIVSIEIQLKDYEPIKFTMAEAKELHEQLDALFADKNATQYIPYPIWNRPYYTWQNASGVNIRSAVVDVSTIGDAYGTAAQNFLNSSVTSAATEMKVSYNGA